MMVMELGEFHKTTRVVGKAAFSVVQIDPSLVGRMAEELDLKGTARVRPLSADDPALRRAMLDFVSRTATGADVPDLQCGLMDLVRDLWKACGDLRFKLDPVVHRGIRRARDAIREQFAIPNADAESPRLEDLARVSGLGVFRFSHAFRNWVGISPHAYLNLCRLSVARRLLEQGMSATDAAAALRFADLPHFSRHFRRQFGLSPKRWSGGRTHVRGTSSNDAGI
jgi:AraC-like DNA-binding protein